MTRELPTTYTACREQFLNAAHHANLMIETHPIDARGRNDEALSIDVVRVGSRDAPKTLLVLSGVHGAEGFIGSALQCDFIRWIAGQTIPSSVGVVIVHAVNPWGMAWHRRQNEHNVDLNRNWHRNLADPSPNDAYDEIHHTACPDSESLPTIDELFLGAAPFIERRGLAWIRDAITGGQYTHPDGLHFGGDRTEQSNLLLETIVDHHLDATEHLLIVDLHTGHGPRGEVTLLSDQPPGSQQHLVLAQIAAVGKVEATTDNPNATTGQKQGQIANGIRDLRAWSSSYATSLEFGTASDEDQLIATYQEQWVHRQCLRSDPRYTAATDAYRACFTPNDPMWVDACLTSGSAVLQSAFSFVCNAA